MTTLINQWAKAIQIADPQQGPSLVEVVRHIRTGILEGGFVSRTKITLGLKEAYAPFGWETSRVKELTGTALDILCLVGDIEEFHTSSSRAYAPTAARVVDTSAEYITVLGSVALDCAPALTRRVPTTTFNADGIPRLSIKEELGRPQWRTALAELGGSAQASQNAIELYRLATRLATAGERYIADDTLAVLSGRSSFFGKVEPSLTGRWHRVGKIGAFPGIINSGYARRNVVVNLDDSGNTTIWEPPNRDIWRWIVVGSTLEQGDEIFTYNATTSMLKIHVPPPRQIERVALILGEPEQAWSWKMQTSPEELLRGLLN